MSQNGRWLSSRVESWLSASLSPASWRPATRPLAAAADGFDGYVREARESFSASGPWPVTTDELWEAFHLQGSRLAYEEPYFSQRRRLGADALIYATTRHEGIRADAVTGTRLILDQETWAVPAHWSELRRPSSLPRVDLFAAETAALLAWVRQVGAVDGSDAERIAQECMRRVVAPFTRERHWWDAGIAPVVNNWIPWITANVLECGMLLCDDPQERSALLLSAAGRLDDFIDAYPADGYCDEGASYWWLGVGKVLRALAIIEDVTAGAVDGYAHPRLPAMLDYPADIAISATRQISIGDSTSRIGPARPGELARIGAPVITALPYRDLHRAAMRVGMIDVARYAAWAARFSYPELPSPRGSSRGIELGPLFAAVTDAPWLTATAEGDDLAGLRRVAWYPSGQLLVARSDERPGHGMTISAKGGNNAESHNHNDVGSVTLAWRGQPLLVDAGRGVYDARTFDPATRYQIWNHNGSHHNVPLVAGHAQVAAASARARSVAFEERPHGCLLSMDISSAYPGHDPAGFWRRTVEFDEERPQLTVRDEWSLNASSTAPHSLQWLCANPVEITGDGVLVGGVLRIASRPQPDAVQVECIDVSNDASLADAWGASLWIVRMQYPDAMKDVVTALSIE
ncbi:MAG: heparinase II/III family protein [Microbacterium sp.]